MEKVYVYVLEDVSGIINIFDSFEKAKAAVDRAAKAGVIGKLYKKEIYEDFTKYVFKNEKGIYSSFFISEYEVE